MSIIGTVDLNEVLVLGTACISLRSKIRELKTARTLETAEVVKMLSEEVKGFRGETTMTAKSTLYNSLLGPLRMVDELRVELLRVEAENEQLRAESAQKTKRLDLADEQCKKMVEKQKVALDEANSEIEKLRAEKNEKNYLDSSLEEKMKQLFTEWEQQKVQNARKFIELEKQTSNGIQKKIDDDQLKMALEKIEKLEKENSALKDQATSNFFEMEHKDKKIQENERILEKKNQEIRELSATLDETEMEVQDQYQRISILQKDNQDSESSIRELLRSNERVVQSLMEQREKDNEKIQELTKKQDANSTRITELMERNRLLRSGATYRVQALKDTVTKKEMEIISLKKQVINWK